MVDPWPPLAAAGSRPATSLLDMRFVSRNLTPVATGTLAGILYSAPLRLIGHRLKVRL